MYKFGIFRVGLNVAEILEFENERGRKVLGEKSSELYDCDLRISGGIADRSADRRGIRIDRDSSFLLTPSLKISENKL